VAALAAVPVKVSTVNSVAVRARMRRVNMGGAPFLVAAGSVRPGDARLHHPVALQAEAELPHCFQDRAEAEVPTM